MLLQRNQPKIRSTPDFEKKSTKNQTTVRKTNSFGLVGLVWFGLVKRLPLFWLEPILLLNHNLIQILVPFSLILNNQYQTKE